MTNPIESALSVTRRMTRWRDGDYASALVTCPPRTGPAAVSIMAGKRLEVSVTWCENVRRNFRSMLRVGLTRTCSCSHAGQRKQESESEGRSNEYGSIRVQSLLEDV